MTTPTIADLRTEAQAVRTFLEERFTAWHAERPGPAPSPVSTSMCRFGALFLQKALEDRWPDMEWIVVGGCEDDDPEAGADVDLGRIPGGIRDAAGAWQGHYWVTDGGFEFIVDVTADQFGHAPVIAEHDHDGYRDNYWGEAVAEHLRDVEWRVEQWREAWTERDLAPESPAP